MTTCWAHLFFPYTKIMKKKKNKISVTNDSFVDHGPNKTKFVRGSNGGCPSVTALKLSFDASRVSPDAKSLDINYIFGASAFNGVCNKSAEMWRFLSFFFYTRRYFNETRNNELVSNVMKILIPFFFETKICKMIFLIISTNS